MCLGTIGKIIEMSEGRAVIDINGVTVKVATGLLKDLNLGDIVMVHAGCAIQKIDEKEADELQNLANEISEIMKIR